MSNNSKDSYTSAGVVPWKLLSRGFQMKPYHIQFIPTNHCNGKCTWCSCSEVDRSMEMTLIEARDMLLHFKKLGAEAVTITGGGEPTLHRDFDRILIAAEHRGYKISLVTNGIQMAKGRVDFDLLNQTLTWMRISIINTEGYYDAELVRLIASKLSIDIGISFTVTASPNINTAKSLCKLADMTSNITHIRFVTDILTANSIDTIQAMDELSRQVKSDKAIFQYRNTFTSGATDCRMGQLKPVINVDGYVYPCCGVQYATEEQRTMPERFKICKWNMYKGDELFDGSICSKCYYNEYNTCLRGLISDYAHKEFI